jgi:multiple sugar transport system substrate-binding protein
LEKAEFRDFIMEIKRHRSPELGRRRFIGSALSSAASLVVPGASLAKSNGQFHSRIAELARQRANKGSRELRLLLPEGCEDNLVPVIRAFSDATGVSMTTTTTAVDDINAQLLLDAMSGSGDYDLALPATFGLPDLVSAKAIISISQYAKKYEPANFRDGILYSTGDSFDGELYGFQTDGDAYVMFYNRTFLENPAEQARYESAYGVPLEVPQTWEELDRQMAFFNRPTEGMHGGLLFRTAGYLAWEWWVRFHAKGYWPLSETLEPQVNSEAGIAALEEMIRASAHLVPETNSLGLFANWERYSRGDVYCNIGWGGSQKYLNAPTSPMRGKMVYGPTPGGIVDDELLLTPYFNWGWNYVVTSSSADPETAYLFALFAATPVMSTLSVQQQGGYFDPFRREHYENSTIRSIYSPEFLDVHRRSLQTCIPDLYIAQQGLYTQSLSSWLHRALSGAVPPKTALDQVAMRWALLNNRSDKERQTQRWLNLREKYPETIRSRLRDLS